MFSIVTVNYQIARELSSKTPKGLMVTRLYQPWTQLLCQNRVPADRIERPWGRYLLYRARRGFSGDALVTVSGHPGHSGHSSQGEAEYAALRGTIRERGTARVWIVLAAMLGWGALVVITIALVPIPVVTLVPLLVLVTGFEIVFSLHTGVERIGRYLQVFFEEETDGARWEHVAMVFGQGYRGIAPDPMFAGVFIAAAVLNFMPVGLSGGVPVEFGAIGVVHLLFVVRVIAARRQAGKQRALDLARFRELKAAKTPVSVP